MFSKMFNSLKKFSIVAFSVLVLIQNASAWEYNYSTIAPITEDQRVGSYNSRYKVWTSPICGDARFDLICNRVYGSERPVGREFDLSRPERAEECNSFTNGNDCDRHFIHPMSHLGFKYSCYYHAFSFVKDAETKIQPLTNNLNTVKEAITQIKETKLNQSINVGMLPADSNTWAFPYSTDTGAGTSAMQGLLWAWRNVSNKWTGVWSANSGFLGDDVNLRRALPSNKNSKHIIIISDGVDTDGVQNYHYRDDKGEFAGLPNMMGMIDQSKIEKNDPFYLSSPGSNQKSTIINFDGDLGVVYRSYPTDNVNKQAFDTCDAHVPQDSIPYALGDGVSSESYAHKSAIGQEGYVEVCNELQKQGIKVHTILYGYGGEVREEDKVAGKHNDRLINCSMITGGEMFTDVSADKLEDTLEEIFISVAKTGIKLIK